MAAYAAVLSLTFTIKQIQQHPCPPISLDILQLSSLTKTLTFLQNFLEGYSSSYTEDEDELETRIADAAYEAEDVIESYIVDQIHGEPISFVDFFQGLERVIQDLDLIMTEAMEIVKDETRARLPTSSSVSTALVRTFSRVHNRSMVGFEDILYDVMGKLTGQESNLKIVPIVGMGGIGKTTLAKNIYVHPFIVQHFHFLAWVTISQEYSGPEILSQVLSEENRVSQWSEFHKLGERVYKELFGRKYLIVMDDIWSIDAWNKVKNFFPNNNNGSKIMITTRLSNLAFRLSGSHDFQMKFLDDDKSWELLRETVFGEEGCPVELETIGKEIARNCRGLPLSIVVIGGLLTKSNLTDEYWGYILKNLSSLINLENNQHCLKILRTSYNELPIHLKPCLIYMVAFPEDDEIRLSVLIRLWVAEGFLKPIENKTAEQVAKVFIKELIDRNLILVHKLKWNGKAKSCKIHDLLRDLCLREAKKQRFLCVLRPQDFNNIPQGLNMERRICIHDNTEDDYPPQFIDTMKSALFTRSFLLFRPFDEPSPPFTHRLLRVYSWVHYYGQFSRGYEDVEALFQQVNLRYISVDFYNESSMFPTSWFFWNLQTLNVTIMSSKSSIVFPPSEIWKMPHLRHVKLYKLELPNGNGDDFVLENLQTLSSVHNFTCSEDVVKRIPNIKKLKLVFYKEIIEVEGLGTFCLNNLGRLQNLKSLYLNLSNSGSRLHSDPKTMQNLTLPHSLKKLTLFHTNILWDDVTTKIGSLPYIEVLYFATESCVGPEWETVEGQFCSLRFLTILHCDLECLTMDDNHFPRLENIALLYLPMFEEIPSSIGDIETLKSIHMVRCLQSAIDSAERIKEEQESYGNEDFKLQIDPW